MNLGVKGLNAPIYEDSNVSTYEDLGLRIYKAREWKCVSRVDHNSEHYLSDANFTEVSWKITHEYLKCRLAAVMSMILHSSVF